MEAQPAPDLPRASTGGTLSLTAGAALAAIAALAGAILAGPILARATLVLLAAGLGVLAARMMFGGVVVRGDGIVVRNPLSTHRLAWAEVARFALEGPRQRGVVERADGRAIRVWAIRGRRPQRPGAFSAEQLALRAALPARMIEALNQRLEAARAA